MPSITFPTEYLAWALAQVLVGVQSDESAMRNLVRFLGKSCPLFILVAYLGLLAVALGGPSIHLKSTCGNVT